MRARAAGQRERESKNAGNGQEESNWEGGAGRRGRVTGAGKEPSRHAGSRGGHAASARSAAASGDCGAASGDSSGSVPSLV